MRGLGCWMLWCAVIVAPTTGWALTPAEILVIANDKVAGSEALARHYMAQRAIPETHLLLVGMPEGETCSREAYERLLLKQVRQKLAALAPMHTIRCLVPVYGIPLKVAAPALTPREKETVAELRKDEAEVEALLKATPDNEKAKRETLLCKLSDIQARLKTYNRSDQRAAVDSELALARVYDYPLAGWMPNPNFVGFQDRPTEIEKEQVLLVSRLDGPTPEIVRRIMDDSLAVEEKGLGGVAYFDARWPRPETDQRLDAYRAFDLSIHLAAVRLQSTGKMAVVINDQETLFQKGQAPDSALYCGWYSLAQYVDAFEFARGAVAYHVASSECSTLKEPDSQVWCKRLLEEGVAATIGPTSEPYLQSFTVPEIFFDLLSAGRLTLAECYAQATPFLSWQMVLIGDPLYRPFRPTGGRTNGGTPLTF